MNDYCNWELLLFQILGVRGNVFYLVDEQHTYTDIILKINKLRDQEYLVKIEDTYELTEKGMQYFHDLCRTLRKRGLYKYFMENTDYKTIAISIEDIYIPRKRFELE